MHIPDQYKFLVSVDSIQLDIFGEQFDFASGIISSEQCDDITAIHSVTQLLALLNIQADTHLNVNHYPHKDTLDNHPVFDDYAPEMACMCVTSEGAIVAKVLCQTPFEGGPNDLKLPPITKTYREVYH